MVINIAPVLSVFLWLAVSLHLFVKMITVPSCAHNLFYCLAAHTHNKLVLWSFSLHKTTIWITSSPSIWQRTMAQVLSGLLGKVCYTDNVLVTKHARAEHATNLRVAV